MTPAFAVLHFFGAQVQQGPLRWNSLPAPWLMTVIVVVVFLWIRSLYRQERGRSGKGARFLLTALRTATLLLLLLVLSGPFHEETTTVQEKPHLVVLVDTSSSMKLEDAYPDNYAAALTKTLFPEGGAPQPFRIARREIVTELLAPGDEKLLRKWDERFVLHVFGFDADWTSLGTTQRRAGAREEEDPEDPIKVITSRLRSNLFEGPRTNLGAVLRNVANEFARRQDQDLAGVVLLSDGRDTSEGEPPQAVLAQLGGVADTLHVLAVGIGNAASGRNMWIDNVRANDVILVGDEVLFETTVRHTGFDDAPADVTVRIDKVADERGQSIEPQPYRVRQEFRSALEQHIDELPAADAPPRVVRMRVPLDEAGTFRVTVEVRGSRIEDQQADAMPDDNIRFHDVRVVDQHIKVLYVDRMPRHDWRFLSTFLTREPGGKPGSGPSRRSRFLVQGLLQSADRSYEQPASASAERSLKRFPATRPELFDYDVIVLGDVDWRKFDPSSTAASMRILERIVEFVEEGGGLALQPGVDYKNPRDFLGTPLMQLLPINVQPKDQDASESFDEEFRIELTSAGLAHPMFSVVPGPAGGVPSPEEIAKIWRGDADISREWRWYWMYRATDGLRPSATALARVRGNNRPGFLDRRKEPLPVFATMPFGRGKVFWTSLDNTARLRRGLRDQVFGPFWEQILRDLATYRLLQGNKRYKIFVDKDEYYVGQTATVLIRALDANYEPLEDPFLDGVHVEHMAENGDEETLLQGEARPRSLRDEGSEGMYRLYVPLNKKGTVRIYIDREEIAGGRRTHHRAEERFEVVFRAPEDKLKVPDFDTLQAIAQATNPGAEARVLSPPQLAKAVDEISARPRERVLDRRAISLWDRTWVLLLAVGLLALEWILRKRWQMI